MKPALYTAAFLLVASSFAPAWAEPENRRMPGTGSYEAGDQDGPRSGGSKYDALSDKMRDSREEYDDAGEQETGARFKLSHGNNQIDVRCSKSDSTEDCVNAAIILMDHIAMERREIQAKAAPQPPIPGAPNPPPAPQRQ